MIRRIFIAVLLLGFLIGSAFVFHFYRVFFASNTAFETPQKEVLIPSTDTKIATIKNEKTPYRTSQTIGHVLCQKNDQSVFGKYWL